MEMRSITIIHRRTGSDIVSIETNLPSPVYPFDGNMDLTFHCAKGTAKDYVTKHFPNAVEMNRLFEIHESTERSTFSGRE